ncbi:AraC family transcriptional regulator [Paenibacillus humicola]|uniref:AraC family transcriptional regulator n=1 Tax=Paenibacillus humicola TaxID=3110540 RepID=UPI00237C4F55|nr:AraC family transcriptional regulator [Paenibacillus humicola]
MERLKLTKSFAFIPIVGSPEEHDLHVHDCLEIGVLLKHELTYRFGGSLYHGRPGDVFLCRPFEPHWSYAQPDRPFEAVLILFTPSAVRAVPGGSRLLVPFYAGRGVAPRIPASSVHAQRIRELTEAAISAQQRGDAAAETRQFAALIAILLHVSDYAADTLASGDAQPPPQTEVADSIGYILDHYREPLDGDSLVRRSGMGKTRFFEQFRTLTGLSPHDFIVQLRVQHAMDLLRTSERTVIEISDDSGFQSLSAFNKQFKAYCGMSPREYRNGK